MRTGIARKSELPPFHPFFQRSWHSEIWKQVTPEARLVYLALCARYSTKLRNNGKLFLSVRKASKELGFHKDVIAQALRELTFYGFIVMTNPGSLGVVGRGKSPSWRVTELPYMNEPPTYDFEQHTGEKFQEQYTSASYRRREQRRARLMAFVSADGANEPKKTETRPEHPGHPVRNTQDTSVRNTQDTMRQTQPKTVRNTQDISRKKLSISTASEPVGARDTGASAASTVTPSRESEKQQRRRQQETTKAEQDLIEMVIVLRRFLGNAATNGDWQQQMHAHGKVGWSKPAFDRRLRIVKARGWIRIVGDPQPLGDRIRTTTGTLFEATELAPGAPLSTVSPPCQGDISKAAMEQLERLRRGKLPAA
jgi:hypothetical protein